MKKLLFSIVMMLFFTNCIFSQSTDVLTNAMVIKMVKANLSEELIIDEVANSKVNFKLSSTDLIVLSNEKVSASIIKAMKTAQAKQSSAAVPPKTVSIAADTIKPVVKKINTAVNPTDSTLFSKDTLSKTIAVQIKDTVKKENFKVILKDTLTVQKVFTDTLSKPKQLNDTVNKTQINKFQNEKSTLTIESVNYTIPLEEIIRFFDNRYNSFVEEIMKKDKKIKDSIDNGNRIYGLIQGIDKELADKKNADTKKYNSEILQLKNKLKNYRLRYAQYKTNMLVENNKIAKELNDFNEQLNKDIAAKFSDVSQNIKKTEFESAKGRITKTIVIPKQKNNANIISHITPLKEVLYFYQNQISNIQNLISTWSKNADLVIKKDGDLSLQMDSLRKEIENKKINAKQNKKEISALKSQSNSIEKEKKNLAKQMASDSKELSNYIKDYCKEIEITLEERIIDIIDNINYQFQNKL